MRVAVIASGSRGDVEPYVALGKGLQKAGHEVRLVTHENYRTLVEGQRLELWPVTVNVQDITQGAEMRERLAKGNFMSIMSQMAKEAGRGGLAMAEAGLAACRDADMVLTGLGGLFVGLALAEKLDLPLVQAHYIPFTPTRAYPSFLLPPLPSWIGRFVNRPSYHLARQVMWQAFRPADRAMRRRVLGLPPAPVGGPYGSAWMQRGPILYGYSPAVIPPSSDWGSGIHVTGYWFLDPPGGPAEGEWIPPPALVEFLEAGPAPVYVGFGSMTSRKPEEMTALIVQALARAGQRGVLLSGWGALQRSALPDTVLMLETIPFAWLFPRMAAIVHHGGAGTTAAALRAGAPSLVVPFFADQPFWGRRVAELGVGPRPIPQRQLTAERLAEAIRTMVSDETMRGRAAALGARIRGEDGVARAVDVLEKAAKGGVARGGVS